jgi:hypothetical protein
VNEDGDIRKATRNDSLKVTRMCTIPSLAIVVLVLDDGHIEFMDMRTLKLVGSTKIQNATRISSIIDVICNQKYSIFVENSNYFELISNENLFNIWINQERHPAMVYEWEEDSSDNQNAEKENKAVIPPIIFYDGPFPINDSNRLVQYRSCFSLPLNQAAFHFLSSNSRVFEEHAFRWRQSLVGGGGMVLFKSERLTRRLVETASLLSTWESVTRGGDEFLRSPEIVGKIIFPFVKIFGNNFHFLFELIVFILRNFFRGWFSRIGSSIIHPLKLVADIDSIFSQADEVLYRHIKKLVSSSCHSLAGPVSTTNAVGCFVYDHMCTSLLTEVFPTSAWIRFLDLLALSCRNSRKIDEKIFLNFFIQFLIFRRSKISAFRELQQLANFLSSQDATVRLLDVETIFKRAMGMPRSDPSSPFVYISETGNSYPAP